MRLHRFLAALLLGLPMATPSLLLPRMLLWHPRFSAGLPWWCWPAVRPRLQRLLDDSCALDPTQEAEALRLAENELRIFSRSGSQKVTVRALAFVSSANKNRP